MPHTARNLSAALAAVIVTALAAAPSPATAARKSCTRGGATVEAASGGVRVVRDKARTRTKQETRRENLYACWTKTGRRVRVAQEVDLGDDNRASTVVEIVEGRYVGVRVRNEGGVSESIVARVYDARSARLLHTSKACDTVDQGDFRGVSDVAFLDGGGMAMTCRQLLVFRKADAELETLEPLGTDVRQVGVSKYTNGFGQRLFWIVFSGDAEVTRSLVL